MQESAVAAWAALPEDPACDEVTLDLRGDASPVAPGVCPGVRPGAQVATDDVDGNRGHCTFNFVYDGYTVGNSGRVPSGRYIGTAGHCVLTKEGEHRWEPGTGPKAYDSAGRHIGHYVYAVDILEADDVANGAIMFGDSGSGAISADGRALGVIVTVGLHTTGITSAEHLMGVGNMGLTRVPSQVQRAEAFLNQELELVTAPLLTSQ